jgi:hypothetical protein
MSRIGGFIAFFQLYALDSAQERESTLSKVPDRGQVKQYPISFAVLPELAIWPLAGNTLCNVRSLWLALLL